MTGYVVRRFLWLIPVVLTVATVTFLLTSLTPGGPWDKEKRLPAVARRNLDAKFGLDKPRWFNPEAAAAKRAAGVDNPLTLARAYLDSQYFNYLFGLCRFDLGPSYQSKGTESVQSIIRERFSVSMRVGLVALAFSLLVGLPLGALGALRQHTWLDYTSVVTSTIGISIPSFVIGLLLIILLRAQFGISPIRRPEAWGGLGPAYLLPGVVLGLGTMAIVARLTRAGLLEIKRQDYVRAARAKGLGEARIVARHMAGNALIPIVTIIGPATAELLTGSIVVEAIFGVPGLGREFVSSIDARDYSLIMGTTLFYAVLIALANVLVDLSYGLLDPRIRVGR
ncbi:MAG: oligopeptide transport system permease protein [Thermomicrobiales bacterium]|jgi:oligopeptide transport system permease protein|nr:oligopeptide transport system permease protein [Thermomicrobiales bacterium]